MCINPIQLEDDVEVGCRHCWQCRENRVNDLVGRCLAEQTESDQTLAVTLTYEGDGPETVVLTYSDVQRFLKRLRFTYPKTQFRYIVAGEYGSKKGRAHWHIVLFLKGETLDVVEPSQLPKLSRVKLLRGKKPQPTDKIAFDERMYWKTWNQGFVFFQRPDYGGFRYLLKYVLKEQSIHKDGTGVQIANTHLAMSKKPPLGHDFFQRLADDYVDQRITPREPFYSFRDQMDVKKNKRRRFYLRGRMRELFLNAFMHKWRWKYGEDFRPSEMMDEHQQKHFEKLPQLQEELYTDAEELRDELACRVLSADFQQIKRLDERDAKDNVNHPHLERMVAFPDGTLLEIWKNGETTVHFGDEEKWRVKSDQLDETLKRLGVQIPALSGTGRAYGSHVGGSNLAAKASAHLAQRSQQQQKHQNEQSKERRPQP